VPRVEEGAYEGRSAEGTGAIDMLSFILSETKKEEVAGSAYPRPRGGAAQWWHHATWHGMAWRGVAWYVRLAGSAARVARAVCVVRKRHRFGRFARFTVRKCRGNPLRAWFVAIL